MTAKLDAKQVAASLGSFTNVIADQWKFLNELLQATNGLPKLPVAMNRAAIDPFVDMVVELEVIAFNLEEQVIHMKILVATCRVKGIIEDKKQDELLMERYAKFEKIRKSKEKVRKELSKMFPLFQVYDVSNRLVERADIIDKLAPLYDRNEQLKQQNEKIQAQLRNQSDFLCWLAMSNADLAA